MQFEYGSARPVSVEAMQVLSRDLLHHNICKVPAWQFIARVLFLDSVTQKSGRAPAVF